MPPVLLLMSLLLAQKPVALPGLTGLAAQAGGLDVIVVVEGEDPGAVWSGLPAADFRLHRAYQRLPAFAGHASARALQRLAADPRVTAIQLDHLGHAATAESAVAIGSAQVRSALGLSGRGVTIAVLDTGVDARHPDLDGGVVAQKCFVLGGCPPLNTDTGDLAPEGNGHGTHVSGTITGDGVVAPPGIAPGATLVVVRVFDAAGVGRVSDWAAALDWVLVNHAALGVRIVNLSLGTDVNFPGLCDTDEPLLTLAIGKLREAGVILFAASGNDGAAAAIGAPACVTGAVAVGATYDADLGREPDTGTYQCGCADENADAGSVVCFSNSSAQLALLAPGSRITAAAPGGGKTDKRGTSQAVPHASAVAALLLELDPTLSVDELEQILISTGSPRLDPKNQRSTPLLDARAAVRAVQASYCSRRADAAPCLLELPCDGGSCANGSCRQGACVLIVPAVTGALPLAKGCGAGAGGVGLGGLALVALGRLLGRRRLPRRG